MISGVARIPPVDTLDDVLELAEDDPDELVRLEPAELIGVKLVVAVAEVMLSRDWRLDWTEAD